MRKSTSNEKLCTALGALGLLVLAGVACKLSSLPGAKMSMFE